ncbi:Outer-membrane lipoprotein carrier protein [Burkholderiales bacterium]|nr:MAG: outer membrane lipoprotein chaperone LolA [Burkholderiales bacterium]CAG1011756.1 Outer-membrane lipoprotein carrier protein [Burkholderiales bacterium]
MIPKLLAVLAFVFALVVAATDALASATDRLRAFTRDTQTARASFSQTVFDKTGRKLQESQGQLQLQRPGRFRWVYEKPNAQLIVGDGRRVWTFDEDLNQVTVRPFDKVLGATPAALLAGTQEIENAFELADLPAAEGLEWVAAKPRARDAGVTGIRLGFSGTSLARMELEDAFGQRTVITLSGLEKNPRLAPEVFKFFPPRGADVIGE